MMIRHLAQECKVCAHIDLPALQQVLTTETIQEALGACGKQTQRTRKLTAEAVGWVLIAANLYTSLSLGRVLDKITQGLRLLVPTAPKMLPGENALTYRRYQMGVAPLHRLFRQVCRPVATEQTPGAFVLGVRLMALDGHIINVPDTPENAAYFGRSGTDRGQAAYPQAQSVCLSECGTHVIVDCGVWPYGLGEQTGVPRLLRSVEAGMLVRWDRGLHSYDLVTGVLARDAHVLARDAHVLARLSAQVKPQRLHRLEDGSWLVWITPSDYGRKQTGAGGLLRLIEYTLDDPALPGYGQTHRLLTSLLDATRSPAHALACAYHQRWEIEVAFDEIETHQQKDDTLLRSRKPVGVLQEFYALLLAHYCVRALMHQAAQQAQIDPRCLSFTRALRLVGEAAHDFAIVHPQEWPQRYERLLQDRARDVVPERRLRRNARVVKPKMSNFALKRPEHRQIRQPCKPFREAVVVI